MADTNRRIPLWAIALVGGLGVFTILGLCDSQLRIE